MGIWKATFAAEREWRLSRCDSGGLEREGGACHHRRDGVNMLWPSNEPLWSRGVQVEEIEYSKSRIKTSLSSDCNRHPQKSDSPIIPPPQPLRPQESTREWSRSADDSALEAWMRLGERVANGTRSTYAVMLTCLCCSYATELFMSEGLRSCRSEREDRDATWYGIMKLEMAEVEEKAWKVLGCLI